jgi:hypothetical protein
VINRSFFLFLHPKGWPGQRIALSPFDYDSENGAEQPLRKWNHYPI